MYSLSNLNVKSLNCTENIVFLGKDILDIIKIKSSVSRATFKQYNYLTTILYVGYLVAPALPSVSVLFTFGRMYYQWHANLHPPVPQSVLTTALTDHPLVSCYAHWPNCSLSQVLTVTFYSLSSVCS